ncbi:hypothetical protein FRC10_005838 [Ceratobasidium sp. 414]|nr:hypothetical protein FRC10_005838 [Ceratobasidium sp. 414]
MLIQAFPSQPNPEPKSEPQAPTSCRSATSPVHPNPEPSAPALDRPPQTPTTHAAHPLQPKPTSKPCTSAHVIVNAAKKATEAEQARHAAEATKTAKAGPASRGKKTLWKQKATKSKAK